MNVWQQMQADLDDLAAQGLRRFERVLQSASGPRALLDGRHVRMFCSNDYLALADDPAVKAAAVEAIGRWGVGAAASRLLAGTMAPHVELERALAAFKGTQAAIVTSTGWMANHAAIAALAGHGDLILSDKLNHASIIDAARASGATLRTYHHCDAGRAAALLEKFRSRYRRCLIVTDSLFSMDGDIAPLPALADLAGRYDAQLLIDEAHATGVLGEFGRGAAELLGVEGRIDATVGTLSKALGCLGGFVAGPAVLIERIRNTARPYIFTTALPPAIAAAAMAALQIVRDQPDRRDRVLALAADFGARLAAAGIATANSVSQIVPVIVGDASAATRPGREAPCPRLPRPCHSSADSAARKQPAARIFLLRSHARRRRRPRRGDHRVDVGPVRRRRIAGG